MIEGLVATGLLALFVGLSARTPEVPNHNTQYCVAAPTRSNPKQEQNVSKGTNCSKGSMAPAPSKQTPLSERKAK